MGTLVNLGSEPPKKPGADKSAKKGEAGSVLSNISLTPQTIGIGVGVVVVLGGLIWFAFGRGGGESAATGTPAGNAAAYPGGAAAAYPGGAGYPGGDNAVGAPAAYPSGGAPAPSASGMGTGTPGAVPVGGPAPDGAIPPSVSLNGGGGGGGSVTTGSGTVQPQIAGAPVSVDANGKTTPADAKSPFRKQPNGQVIDLRDPPTN